MNRLDEADLDELDADRDAVELVATFDVELDVVGVAATLEVNVAGGGSNAELVDP
jgi:hypothetical protein